MGWLLDWLLGGRAQHHAQSASDARTPGPAAGGASVITRYKQHADTLSDGADSDGNRREAASSRGRRATQAGVPRFSGERVPTGGRRCKLDPGLKAPLLSKAQPDEDEIAFKLEPEVLSLHPTPSIHAGCFRPHAAAPARARGRPARRDVRPRR